VVIQGHQIKPFQCRFLQLSFGGRNVQTYIGISLSTLWTLIMISSAEDIKLLALLLTDLTYLHLPRQRAGVTSASWTGQCGYFYTTCWLQGDTAAGSLQADGMAGANRWLQLLLLGWAPARPELEDGCGGALAGPAPVPAAVATDELEWSVDHHVSGCGGRAGRSNNRFEDAAAAAAAANSCCSSSCGCGCGTMAGVLDAIAIRGTAPTATARRHHGPSSSTYAASRWHGWHLFV